MIGSLALDSSPDQVTVSLPELDHLRRPEFPELLVTDQEPEPEPVADPVIGPVLAAARRRLSLDVDGLAERTRIRPHVIEAIEVDDFAPCGGDFYARGHLRTLARVLGVEAAPLLESYDERYAHSPVSPRQVFEAELATGATGSLRGTRGGPNWSVLVAALMAVVLAWSVARLVMDGPVDLPVAPRLDGSGGVNHGSPATSGDAVPVLVRAAGGGAHVEVRDGNGRLVFTGDLAYGSSRSLQVRAAGAGRLLRRERRGGRGRPGAGIARRHRQAGVRHLRAPLTPSGDARRAPSARHTRHSCPPRRAPTPRWPSSPWGARATRWTPRSWPAGCPRPGSGWSPTPPTRRPCWSTPAASSRPPRRTPSTRSWRPPT